MKAGALDLAQRGEDQALARPRRARIRLAAAGALAIGAAGVVGLRIELDDQGVGSQTPAPTNGAPAASPGSTTGAWWPQANIDEVGAAQALADAGNPDYTWQTEDALGPDNRPWSAPILIRYLHDVLGWEAFRHTDGYAGVEDGSRYTELVFYRCAPGRPNPLYPNDPEVGGCAPTLDDFRYETVMLTIEQPLRRGSDGIWVVTASTVLGPRERSSTLDHLMGPDPIEGQIVQLAPPSDAEATEVVRAFMEARLAGTGAERFVHRHPDEDETQAGRFVPPPAGVIPLLYAPGDGVAYERYEIDRKEGPIWPTGTFRFALRLFAEDGKKIEQWVAVVRTEDGGVGVMEDYPKTMIDGQPAPIPYRFLGGAVSLVADGRWTNYPNALAFGRDAAGDFTMLADARTVADGCKAGSTAASATALVEAIRANPNVDVTASATVIIGGLDAQRIEIDAAPGATPCSQPSDGRLVLFDGTTPWQIGEGDHTRLYLLDLPRGQARTLVIAVTASEAQVDRVFDAASEILDSVEFHLP